MSSSLTVKVGTPDSRRFPLRDLKDKNAGESHGGILLEICRVEFVILSMPCPMTPAAEIPERERTRRRAGSPATETDAPGDPQLEPVQRDAQQSQKTNSLLAPPPTIRLGKKTPAYGEPPKNRKLLQSEERRPRRAFVYARGGSNNAWPSDDPWWRTEAESTGEGTP